MQRHCLQTLARLTFNVNPGLIPGYVQVMCLLQSAAFPFHRFSLFSYGFRFLNLLSAPVPGFKVSWKSNRRNNVDVIP